MSKKILCKIFEELKIAMSNEKKVLIIWHGGEPLLAGLEFFETAVKLEKKIFKNIQVENCIQTNGTLVNEEWCKFFVKNNFHPSISLDGPQKLHDSLRVDMSNKGTYEKVMHNYRLMKSYGLRVGSLGVITPSNVDHPEEIFKWLVENNISSWDFLLSAEAPEGCSKLFLPVKQAAEFSIKLFNKWFEADDPSIKIRTFRTILKTELGAEPDVCSWKTGCLKFVSFDNNGDVYLCAKFHARPETKYGNIVENSLGSLLTSQRVKTMHKEITENQSSCGDCKWLKACGGGCSFVKYNAHKNFNTHFVHCEARKALFEHVSKKIRKI